MWMDWLRGMMADIPWQRADHLSRRTGAAQFQMPWCGVPRQWALCRAIIPCVSRDRPSIWRGPLVCIHGTLRNIIRWPVNFITTLSGCYKYRASLSSYFLHTIARLSVTRTVRRALNDLGIAPPFGFNGCRWYSWQTNDIIHKSDVPLHIVGFSF